MSDDLTKDQQIDALSKANAKLSRMLAISEYQKENLKKRITDLETRERERLAESS